MGSIPRSRSRSQRPRPAARTSPSCMRSVMPRRPRIAPPRWPQTTIICGPCGLPPDNSERGRSDEHQQSGSHGDRAVEPRRARLRHFLAAAARAHHLPQRADRRQCLGAGLRAAAVAGIRQSEEGDRALHQFAGRHGDQRLRHLRHDAVYRLPGLDGLHGHGPFDGLVPADGRHARPAYRAAQFQHPAAPAARAASRARRRTSSGMPRTSSRPSAAWPSSTPGIAAARWKRSSARSTATTS